MRRTSPLVLAAVLALACNAADPADGGPGPCGTGDPDAATCGEGERCIDGACTPWAEEVLAEGIDCPPALGAAEVVFFAEGELRAVAKSGGLVRTVGPRVAENSCGQLQVDGGQVFLFFNDQRDWMGSLHAYPISGGDPVLLTEDLRYVFGATTFGDHIFLAVGVHDGELLAVDPTGWGWTRQVLATEGRFEDVVRVGDELFVLEVDATEQGTVVWVDPTGGRGPVVATARGGASLRATDRGDLLLVTNSCDHEAGSLRLQLRRAGTAAFATPVEIPCNGNLVAVDTDHAYFRDLDEADRRLWRRPWSGGEPVRVEGSDALWYVFGLDDAWLYGVRDGTIVRIPK